MSYIVLARKYRPQTLDELVGQGHVATTLKNAIKTERLAQAYLFTGQRGVGKTSTARILAKSLNCVQGLTVSPCGRCNACKEISSSTSLDVLEIDGASNRGIDEIRTLRENVKFSPTQGKFKIYIIDEVHMLTEPAFNALLKTLEEPPKHVKFIFATTQPSKIPLTILSRCQRFDFRRIPMDKILAKLKQIIKQEKLKIKDDALFYIARASQGSLRDAESVLDQLASYSEKEIDFEDVVSILGVYDQRVLFEFTQATISKDAKELLTMVEREINSGKGGDQFISSLVDYFRGLMMTRLSDDPARVINLPPESISQMAAQAGSFSIEEIIYIIDVLTNARLSIKKRVSPRVVLEMAVIKIARRGLLVSVDEVLGRLNELESKLKDDGRQCLEEAVAGQAAVGEEKTEETTPEGPSFEKLSSDESSPPEVSLSQARQYWRKLLDILARKKMSVATFLMKGKLIGMDGDVVNVGFLPELSFHRESLESKKNKKIIEENFSRILGRQVRVAFCTLEKSAEQPDPVKVQDQEPEIPAIVRSTLDIFKGKIMRKDHREL